MEQSDWTLAEDLYAQIVEQASDDVKANNGLMIALRQQGKLDQALAVGEHLMVIAADDPVSLNNYGILMVFLDRNEEALAKFRRAVEINPGYTDAAINFERLEELLNRGDGADAPPSDAAEPATNP